MEQIVNTQQPQSQSKDRGVSPLWKWVALGLILVLGILFISNWIPRNLLALIVIMCGIIYIYLKMQQAKKQDIFKILKRIREQAHKELGMTFNVLMENIDSIIWGVDFLYIYFKHEEIGCLFNVKENVVVSFIRMDITEFVTHSKDMSVNDAIQKGIVKPSVESIE